MPQTAFATPVMQVSRRYVVSATSTNPSRDLGMRHATRSNRSYVEVEAGTAVTRNTPLRSIDNYYKRISDKLPADRNKIESLLLDRKMKCT